MFVESFHNQLKTVFFEGKRNRRIDVLIDILLQIEKNLFMTRLRRMRFNLPSGENIDNEDRHQRSLDIKDSCILQISDNFFTVTSSDSTYDIKKLVGTCNELYCFNKCKKFPCVNLCKHLFSCSCTDYKIGHVCKHLHKIHAVVNLNSNTNKPSNADVDFTPEHHLSDNDTGTSVSTQDHSDQKIQQIEKKLNIIAEQIRNNPSVQKHTLDNILCALDHIISANEGSNGIDSSLKDFKKTEKISSNAKNLLQPRFRPTSKKPGRIPKPHFKKPTDDEMRNLLPNDSGSSQVSSVPVSLPGPSVAPYPPLRLVPQTTNALPTQPPQQSVFSVGTGLGQPTWMRVPPSMIGRRIVTTINGKKQVIVFTNGGGNDAAEKDGE
ncbi:uncharacterized protein LOC134266472 [Saccostrea cucullata]|uniref:uncharacterized protein LOC134266472 n=1 Tax=Saccostrea cuccullata TaxID=36930 RepID=UPI002ED1B549